MFFKSSCFTDVKVECCKLNPSGAICWKNLRSLYISWVKLDEDLFENILSGSPQLETLVLNNCYGCRRLDITSKSVQTLVFKGYLNPYNLNDDYIIEINAPNILSLTIQEELLLHKLLFLNVSSLVEANLDYKQRGRYVDATRKEAEEEMLKRFLLNLSHVKELKIGSDCSEVLSCLEAKGFVFPSILKFTG